jgi:hypothetical protein
MFNRWHRGCEHRDGPPILVAELPQWRRNMKRIFSRPAWFAFLLLGIACEAIPVHANPEIYDRALASTGWLINPREANTALGTCWIADRERNLLITSYHLIGESKEVLVYFPERVDGRVAVEASYYLKKVPTINGRVVAVDRPRDLALIEVPSLPRGARKLMLAQESARPGDDVHSIGNSGLSKNVGGMLWRYTRGNVRQIYPRKLSDETGSATVTLLETQSPVNMGDSGGPILNDRGEVVGVAAAYDPKERLVSQNIDVSEIRRFLQTGICQLSRTRPARSDIVTKNSVLGEWKVSAKLDDGNKARGHAHFKNDGTYVLVDSDEADDGSQAGRFAYANGMLLMIADDGQAAFKLTWVNANRFSAAKQGAELHFDR